MTKKDQGIAKRVFAGLCCIHFHFNASLLLSRNKVIRMVEGSIDITIPLPFRTGTPLQCSASDQSSFNSCFGGLSDESCKYSQYQKTLEPPVKVVYKIAMIWRLKR
jgi:hypothetical protein